jgi:hypothetical protein
VIHTINVWLQDTCFNLSQKPISLGQIPTKLVRVQRAKPPSVQTYRDDGMKEVLSTYYFTVPVISDPLAGEQTGAAAWQFVSFKPFAAILSKFGVTYPPVEHGQSAAGFRGVSNGGRDVSPYPKSSTSTTKILGLWTPSLSLLFT